MPDDGSEIPTPAATQHHTHLKSLADRIPHLDPEAQVLLLLGREDQFSGPHSTPYDQRLDFGLLSAMSAWALPTSQWLYLLVRSNVENHSMPVRASKNFSIQGKGEASFLVLELSKQSSTHNLNYPVFLMIPSTQKCFFFCICPLKCLTLTIIIFVCAVCH